MLFILKLSFEFLEVNRALQFTMHFIVGYHVARVTLTQLHSFIICLLSRPEIGIKADFNPCN